MEFLTCETRKKQEMLKVVGSRFVAVPCRWRAAHAEWELLHSPRAWAARIEDERLPRRLLVNDGRAVRFAAEWGGRGESGGGSHGGSAEGAEKRRDASGRGVEQNHAPFK
jgi:hypothetical protein